MIKLRERMRELNMSKKIKEVILHKSMKDLNFAKDVLTNLPGKLFEESIDMKSIFTVLKRTAHTSSSISEESLAVKLEDVMGRNKHSEDEITNALAYMDKLYTVQIDDRDESLNSEIEKYVKTEMSKDILTKFIIENKQEDSENLTE